MDVHHCHVSLLEGASFGRLEKNGVERVSQLHNLLQFEEIHFLNIQLSGFGRIRNLQVHSLTPVMVGHFVTLMHEFDTNHSRQPFLVDII